MDGEGEDMEHIKAVTFTLNDSDHPLNIYDAARDKGS